MTASTPSENEVREYCQYCKTYHKHKNEVAAQDFRQNICKPNNA